MSEWRDHVADVEDMHSFCVIRRDAKPRGREGFFVLAKDLEQATRKAAILWPGEEVEIEPWGDRK